MDLNVRAETTAVNGWFVDAIVQPFESMFHAETSRSSRDGVLNHQRATVRCIELGQQSHLTLWIWGHHYSNVQSLHCG